MRTLESGVPSRTVLAGLLAGMFAISLGAFALADFPSNQQVTNATQVSGTQTSGVSQAVPIEVLAWDFRSFEYYTLAGAGCPPHLGTYPAGCNLVPRGTAYNVSRSAGSYIAFSVNVTNVDPKGRTYVLYSSTELEACPLSALANNSAATQQRCGTLQWLLGNVTKGVVVPSAKGITIAEGQAATLYFVESAGGIPSSSNNLTPIILLIQGTICQPDRPDCSMPLAVSFPFATVSWN